MNAPLPVPSPVGRSSARHLAGIPAGLRSWLRSESRLGARWPRRAFWESYGARPVFTPGAGRVARGPLLPSVASGTDPPHTAAAEPGLELEGTSKSGVASRGYAGTFFCVLGS